MKTSAERLEGFSLHKVAESIDEIQKKRSLEL